MIGAQDRDYNCGVYAAMYVLEKYYHLQSDPRVLERVASTTSENGTSHEGMYAIFDYMLGKVFCHPLYEKPKFQYNASVAELGANLPAIINYQDNGEGHYAVATEIDPDTGGLVLWNPATGKEEIILKVEEWASKYWYSNLYGARWFLHVV